MVLGQNGVVLVGTWWYCVSIERYCLINDGTGSVEGSTGWYLVVLSQYNLVLLGIKWYWVSIRLLCLYILKKAEIWSGVTETSHTHSQTTEHRATQLV